MAYPRPGKRTRRSRRPFAGRVAPGAGAGGADCADLEPVLRAAGQPRDRAIRRLADIALGPRSRAYREP